MGVHGLWPILQPCARPTPLPTLNRKRLAVDASIWIYQFLKAVRDKEGNALRNSHVVGFFRRICKLLYFGIKPVFVFDGGAPSLKRQTIIGRKQRREGRREDAVRTAGRLLAVQMKRREEEEYEKKKRDKERERDGLAVHQDENEGVIADDDNLVYVGELGMNAQERQQTRKFHKKDAYHLPDLTNGIEGMGQPNDPRIMSAEELEEYARQFNNGEDVNMYDFSKIDFNGDFFMSLPPGDRYNILNAARLRSRLRMGLSKEQLEDMFPDRMAFSRFQIERVTERNELTQRLMNLNGMNDDGMLGVGGSRIAGESGREYVLVKNDGVEGGWALGVVSSDKSVGERNKPIDVDELDQKPSFEEASAEEEEDFEDVPVEGLNRLPKFKDQAHIPRDGDSEANEFNEQRQRPNTSRARIESGAGLEEAGSLFVDQDMNDGPSNTNADAYDEGDEDLKRAIAMSLQQGSDIESDEEKHLNRAIEISMQKNHQQKSLSEDDVDFEDVPMPEYEQRAVANPKPISSSSGKMVAHIVNNKSNAAVPKRKADSVGVESDSDSGSDMDLQSALSKARKRKAPQKRREIAPVVSNSRNPFDGPLPFESLNFRTSIFGKKNIETTNISQSGSDEAGEDMEGGFSKAQEEEKAKPLPPWLVEGDDIRSQVQVQQKQDAELNAEDREQAEEENRIFKKNNAPIQIDSSEDDSEVEILNTQSRPVEIIDDDTDASLSPPRALEDRDLEGLAEDVRAEPPISNIPNNTQFSALKIPANGPADVLDEQSIDWSESEYGDDTTELKRKSTQEVASGSTDCVASEFASPGLEDDEVQDVTKAPQDIERKSSIAGDSGLRAGPSLNISSGTHEATNETTHDQQNEFGDFDEFDEFSDPDDEELLAQLAVEAEEHARFASTLNNKSERENQEAYERELKALRTQQKKDRRDADEVSHIMITECQALLRLFGLPYITAPMEAEAQCAELVNLGLVDGVVTDDCDIFLFGGTRVYKNMFNSNKFVECYLSSDIEKELSLSRDQLIAIAHLLGSDYTEGLTGIGPVTALEILSEFPTPSTGLDEFREWWMTSQHSTAPVSSEATIFRKKFRRSQATKLLLPPGFPSPAVTEAYLKPDVDSTPEMFQWGVPDLNRLRDFLMATIGWSQERTDEVLVPVIRDMNKRESEGTQSNITRYFEGSVGAGANLASGKEKKKGSKRMQEAVGKLKAKKQGANSLGRGSGTFGDEAARWARGNDLSWTEREKQKVKGQKRTGRGKRKGTAEASLRPEGDVNDQSHDDAADDEGRSGEDSDESRSTVVGGNKSKGQAAKRQRTTA